MFKKIKKFFKKLFKIKKKKKKVEINHLETIEEKEIIEERVEEDLIEIRFVEEVLNELEFSTSSSQSLSFFSVDDLNDDIKIERYNQLIDSIELP